MLGAIFGDIVGSTYEGNPIKTTDFPLFTKESSFTDDTVLTIAVADSLVSGKSYAAALKQWGRKYPKAGYGGNFYQWLMSRCSVAYNSWGNGSAMRVSPIGWAFNDLNAVLAEAARSAEITHNHLEGIKGAQAVAGAIFLARKNKSKSEIKEWIQEEFCYNLERSVESIRPSYGFDVSCQGSVPEAILCFLESSSTEEAIRLAVSLGGDSDTQACIAGAIAEAFFDDISTAYYQAITSYLPNDAIKIVESFSHKFKTQ